MKTLIIALALAAPTAHAASSPGGGCMWNDTSGVCMFANDRDRPTVCDVRIQVTTEKSQKTTKVDKVVIPAKDAYHSPQFRAPWDDKIEKAQIAAKCK